MNNREYILDTFERNFITEICSGELNDCIRFNSTDPNMIILFNPRNNNTYEIRINDYSANLHKYNFETNIDGCILETKRENRLLFLDWSTDELTILQYKMDLIGIKEFVINKIDYNKDYEKYPIKEIIFSNIGDLATFQMYFHRFFKQHGAEETIKIIEDHKLLD